MALVIGLPARSSQPGQAAGQLFLKLLSHVSYTPFLFSLSVLLVKDAS
jgi:hypothetical protein